MGPRISSRRGAARITATGKKDYRTPARFIEKVERRFGSIVWDLAASSRTTQHRDYYSKAKSAFLRSWFPITLRRGGVLWLNPPFDDITPWARTCYDQARKGANVVMLVPSATGASWFVDWIWKKADTYFLDGRLDFIEGMTFPKDCLLAHYHPRMSGGSCVWKWNAFLYDAGKISHLDFELPKSSVTPNRRFIERRAA